MPPPKSKTRIFVQYHHTGVMSKGRLSVANIEGKDDWTPIKQNSKEARIFRIICEKDPQIENPPMSEKAKNADTKETNNQNENVNVSNKTPPSPQN